MAELEMQLDVPSDFPAREIGPFDEELDSIVSVLASIGDELATDPRTRFAISGFGQAPWPTDVATDLPTVLEQLPGTISALEEGRVCVLDLYEQGMERSLRFEPRGESISIYCQSLTAWQPVPDAVTMARGETIAMLRALLDRFLRVVSEAFPSLANHPWVADWARPAHTPAP